MTLEIYHDPLKSELINYVNKAGHSSRELEPVIEESIDIAIKNYNLPIRSRIRFSNLKISATKYLNAVMSQNDTWNNCLNAIKSYQSVFVVGAGLSSESDLPLSNNLDVMLKFFCKNSWEELINDPKKCHDFKEQFKIICDRKIPSDAHNIIISNFPKYIREIVSLNWDDMFEKSAIALGINLDKICMETNDINPGHYLWKFHGDVQRITQDNIAGKGGWVFPDDKDGHVFNCFEQYSKNSNLESEIFSLVIVGYRETETQVYDKIIKIFEFKPPRPTFRITPELQYLNKPGYIIGPAFYTLKKILPVKTKS